MIRTDFIQVYLLHVQQLSDFFSRLFEEKFGLENPKNKKVVDTHLVPFFNHLKEDLWTVIELPYVDKMYRDTYYNYYSSKLRLIERDTIRLSFFSKKINKEDFRSGKSYIDLQQHYGGFLVLRPTFPKIIGRSALSPEILRDPDIECCKASIRATVNSLKFTVEAFPHASQDTQAITCAETTIWSMMEYFGNKYPEYRPVLPSEIIKILQRFSYKRQVPSDGLSLEQIAFAVREFGFGTMIYPKSKDGFNSVISSFVGSGIPVIGVLKKEGLAHAVNIIGRRRDDLEAIVKNQAYEKVGDTLNVLDYDNLEHNYVFIDDNHPPYQIATIDKPTSYYIGDKWHGSSLIAIVVPLYRRIYLEPIRAKKNFKIILKNKKIGIKDDKPRIIRTFLASSRSYKEYVAMNEDLDKFVKEFILTLPMPKFVWVQEVSHLQSFVLGKVDGILLQDATEPTEHSDETNLADIPVFFGYLDKKFFTLIDRESKEIDTFASQFKRYSGNLG